MAWLEIIIFIYMDTQDHAIYHVWIHFIPTSLYPRRRKDIWSEQESNPGPLASQATALTTRPWLLRQGLCRFKMCAIKSFNDALKTNWEWFLIHKSFFPERFISLKIVFRETAHPFIFFLLLDLQQIIEYFFLAWHHFLVPLDNICAKNLRD